jgi:hypothetical protein
MHNSDNKLQANHARIARRLSSIEFKTVISISRTRNGNTSAKMPRISFAIYWFFFSNLTSSAFIQLNYLKVRNVRQRYTADDVLAHPWVIRGAPKTPLQTATNLSRNDSARDVHQMNEHFLMMNRISPMIARLSSRLQDLTSPSPPSVGVGGAGGQNNLHPSTAANGCINTSLSPAPPPLFVVGQLETCQNVMMNQLKRQVCHTFPAGNIETI